MSLDDWLEEQEGDVRFAYCRVDRLREAMLDEKIVSLLADQICVGKAATLKKLKLADKKKAISAEVEHQISQAVSEWHEVAPLEMIAGELFTCDKLPAKTRQALWPTVRREADLLLPVSKAVRTEDFNMYKEIPMGKHRVDVLAHRPAKSTMFGLFSSPEVCWGIELKNDLKEFSRALDQATTFASYTDRTYIACTPALAAEYLAAHLKGRGVKHWDPLALDSKIRRSQLGLILVEPDKVEIVIDVEDTPPTAAKRAEVAPYLVRKNEVDLGE